MQRHAIERCVVYTLCLDGKGNENGTRARRSWDWTVCLLWGSLQGSAEARGGAQLYRRHLH